jgi:hypothetical protein
MVVLFHIVLLLSWLQASTLRRPVLLLALEVGRRGLVVPVLASPPLVCSGGKLTGDVPLAAGAGDDHGGTGRSADAAPAVGIDQANSNGASGANLAVAAWPDCHPLGTLHANRAIDRRLRMFDHVDVDGVALICCLGRILIKRHLRALLELELDPSSTSMSITWMPSPAAS